MGLNKVINVTSHWGIIIVFSSIFHSCCFLSHTEPAQWLTLQRRANRTHLHWQGDQGQSLVMAWQSALQAWCRHFCHGFFGCLSSVWLRSSQYHSIPESWPVSKSCEAHALLKDQPQNLLLQTAFPPTPNTVPQYRRGSLQLGRAAGSPVLLLFS